MQCLNVCPDDIAGTECEIQLHIMISITMNAAQNKIAYSQLLIFKSENVYE